MSEDLDLLPQPSRSVPACGVRSSHRRPAPPQAVPVPPGRPVPGFRPIRRGSGVRHRLRRAVRLRSGAVLSGLAGAALASQCAHRLGRP
ncbi:hypothetical protein ACFW1A_11960 [Kitasatospora sp. NPDC058965]|uniref:hypothetical protein n=1 Tax=Kitasatospora sp. NPDC058965 TaxID=3346682 RepID=UPI003696771A